MKRLKRNLSLSCSIAATLFAGIAASSAAVQPQTFTLQPGWNAVWIDPSPVYESGDDVGSALTAEEVFTNTSISVVARPLLPVGSSEFVTDSTSVFNQGDWLVWYRNPQSQVNSLVTITGNQAYYIKLEGDDPVTVDLSGEVRFFRPDWVAGGYNLVGFTLSAPVSFGDFFGEQGENGGNHPINTIFRLDSSTGVWDETVQSTDLMMPNEAYWIQSVRNSSFSGPVAIDFNGDGNGTLAMGDGPGDITASNPLDPQNSLILTAQELVFSNVDTVEHSIAIELIDPVPADELLIYQVVPGSNALTHTIDPSGSITSWDLGSLAATTTQIATLGADRNWSTGDPLHENLYRIDIGSQFFWLPVTALNGDVIPGDAGSSVPAAVGLWVGEVLLDEVSRVDGTGLVPTTSTAPMRIIIHVDTNGAPWLLSQVMVMQTKTADEDTVPAEQVLVLDEAKIPFFEGIETRGGKRVGRRIETVGYDLPRNDDPAVQAELLEEVVAATPSLTNTTDVTDADIQTFLNAQTSRPSTLNEVYYLRWPLEGGLAPDSVVKTSDTAPLTLDPFHRSNPFRHAFHPLHGAGYAITRQLTISFNSSAVQDTLQGTYLESISGLANVALETRGTVTFSRLSKVSEVQ